MQNGAQSFTELCRQWWEPTCNTAASVLGSRDDAEDATQQVFMRVWTSGAWRKIERPGFYFRQAGRREALSILRQRRRRAVGLKFALRREDRTPPTPDQVLVQKNQEALIRRLVRRLPPRCQLVCTLTLLVGLPHRTVAARLGISVKAVEKQAARGRRLIHQMLNSEDRTSLSQAPHRWGWRRQDPEGE